MAETTSELDRYLRSTPKSKALWEDAKNHMPGGDSRNSIFWAPYPIFVDHATGCHVVNVGMVPTPAPYFATYNI